MKQRKILIIILATAAALTIALCGVAYASYLNYTSYQTNTNPNTPYATASREDFWGWLGGCFGWRTINPTTTATSTKRQPTASMRLNQTLTKATPTKPDAAAGAGKTPQTTNQNTSFYFKE